MKEEIIKHLTTEITNYTTQSMVWRSRIAFAILIGPFAALGHL